MISLLKMLARAVRLSFRDDRSTRSWVYRHCAPVLVTHYRAMQ